MIHFSFLVLLLAAVAAPSAIAQTKKKNVKKTVPAPTPVAEKAEEPLPQVPEPEPAIKRNSRPVEGQAAPPVLPTPPTSGPQYTYEFTQPDFVTSRILIEHDESGKGTISFQRRGYSELFSEPLTVSDAALARLNAAFTELNFLDSAENYQHERDFSHLGVSKITLTRGVKSRAVTLNYAINKNAKILMDEYRKISNQALWIFDITIARENQPLDGPSQMNQLDGLLRRNEISDARQLLPFLRELSDDERLPLIARNHATRIAQQIEKAKK